MGAESNWRLRRLCEIIKFGLAGTDMPGHEYLSDSQVAAIARQIISQEMIGTDKVLLNR